MEYTGPEITCNTMFLASEYLFRVPFSSPDRAFGSWICGSVYRKDELHKIKGLKTGYIYEYHFDYSQPYLEKLISKPKALEIANAAAATGKKYEPSAFQFWNEKFSKLIIDNFYEDHYNLLTADFLQYLLEYVRTYDILCICLDELGYKYIRSDCVDYEVDNFGIRGGHYHIYVFRPEELKLKKAMLISDAPFNALVDITPVIPSLTV